MHVILLDARTSTASCMCKHHAAAYNVSAPGLIGLITSPCPCLHQRHWWMRQIADGCQHSTLRSKYKSHKHGGRTFRSFRRLRERTRNIPVAFAILPFTCLQWFENPKLKDVFICGLEGKQLCKSIYLLCCINVSLDYFISGEIKWPDAYMVHLLTGLYTFN